ncbi:hypothetical protein HYY71_05555 [Candidatus Woesearchaeota archaeon]|nr:hypothetical protein [Candidatus Woesearchaeota archaeon]
MKITKAQISLFLILGIILLFVIGIGYYFVGNLKQEKVLEKTANTQQISADFLPIKSYIDICLKDSSISAAYRIGLKGGYNVLPFDFYDGDYADLPYFYKGKSQIPSKKIVENELEGLLAIEFENCIDFSLFEQQGFNISFTEATANTTILKDKIEVYVDFPVKIRKDGQYAEISSFSYEVPLRLGHILDISKELVNKIEKEPYYTDLTFLLGQDLDISLINSQDCNEIYLLYDNYSANSKISNYLFLFAVKIDEEYCNFRIRNNESFGIEERDGILMAQQKVPQFAHPAYVVRKIEGNSTMAQMIVQK